ncbi:hypothetical protein SUGI_0210720 [Cryptomeria japonica]|uniref:probable CCR4-associated factor 1 homolog 7 n=1 Tax=Cryptomeria japonica TaxID=3369 RepID=UPI002408B4AF|nr:probable CCR4-associated factor 1 homolog 7 [Cryptomeria japonica]GLJ13364.1 hypothetical protein SUGI_0210720 [Cryptomeria japonica]
MASAGTSTGTTTSTGDGLLIREVWAANLEEEFRLISKIVDDYPYLAMDTEFPGVVFYPVGSFQSDAEYKYAELRDNVNLLKLIQLGFTFSDKNGNLPKCGTNQECVWQFNFREFNSHIDKHNIFSIEMLKKCGIDFQRNEQFGIDSKVFRDLFMSSRVVLNENVLWISFQGKYDFGYLIKLLTNQDLPKDQAEFFKLFRTYFPKSYDIKNLLKLCSKELRGGLENLANKLNVERVGTKHQSGSDSLLTSRVFWKLQQGFIDGSIEPLSGLLYDLGIEQ